MRPHIARPSLALLALLAACAHSHTEGGVDAAVVLRPTGDPGVLDAASVALRSLRLVPCGGTVALHALPLGGGVARADHDVTTTDTLALDAPVELLPLSRTPLGRILPAARPYCAVLAILEPTPADPEGPTLRVASGARTVTSPQLAYLDLPLDPPLDLRAETPHGTLSLHVDLSGWDATLDDPSGDALHTLATSAFGASAQARP
jgi:hypothetical protein